MQRRKGTQFLIISDKLPEHDHLQITPLCLLQKRELEAEEREAFICGSSKKSPKEKKWSVYSITSTHSK